MTQSLTDRIQRSRFVVVEADQAAGRLRVRGVGDVCSDLSCRGETVVVTDEGGESALGTLNPGDIIKVESPSGTVERIVVVRRAWEEWASPEV